MRRTTAERQAGFTMAEAIIAMVVIGIIGSFVAVFLQAPVLGYRDSRARAELSDAADNALRYMARDIRLALPNSLRVFSGTHVNFMLTKTGGRYVSEDDGADSASFPHLNFLDSTRRTFTALGAAPTGRQAIVAGDRIVVNNLGVGYQPGDAQDLAAGLNNATVQSVTAGDAQAYQITLATNPFAQQDPPIPDPGARFYVVSGAVSYVCTASAAGTGTLRRYVVNESVGVPTLGTGALLLDNVVTCAFQYESVNERLSMLSMSLTLRPKNSPDGDITLRHQVHF